MIAWTNPEQREAVKDGRLPSRADFQPVSTAKHVAIFSVLIAVTVGWLTVIGLAIRWLAS